MQEITWFKIISTAILSVATFIYGDIIPVLIAFIGLMAIDYVTGVLCAGKNHEISSSKGFIGLKKKLVILLLLTGACFFQKIFQAFSISLPITAVVILAFSVNEMTSITENLIKLNVPVPKKLKQLLADQEKENPSVKG